MKELTNGEKSDVLNQIKYMTEEEEMFYLISVNNK